MVERECLCTLVMQIAHALPKTGYKADNAYGAKAIFEDETCVLFSSRGLVPILYHSRSPESLVL